MENKCQGRLNTIINQFQQSRQTFVALGDETRQLIILALLEKNNQGLRVGGLAQMVHLSRPSISHHMKILKTAGIVCLRKEGTKNYYYLNTDNQQWHQLLELTNYIYKSIENMKGL